MKKKITLLTFACLLAGAAIFGVSKLKKTSSKQPA
jgi:hypothetical protein